MDVNEELKFLGKFKKKKKNGRGVGLRGQSGCNEELKFL